jgi:hypothetical protein
MVSGCREVVTVAVPASLLALIAVFWLGAEIAVDLWGALEGPRFLMVAVFGGLMGLELAGTGLAAFGQFGLLQVCAVGAVSVALLAVHHRRHGTLHCRVTAPRTPEGWAWVAGLGLLVCVAVAVATNGPSFETDTVRYHIVNAAHLLDSGTLWSLPYAEPGEHTATAPEAGELLNALLMLGSHTDSLAYIANVLWMGMLGAAGVVVACACGATWRRATMAWVAVAAMPVMVYLFWHSMMNDLIPAVGVVTALAHWLMAREQGWTLRRMVLVGAALGLAPATKFSGFLDASAVLIPLLWDLHRRRLLWRGALVVPGTAVLFCAVWYVRNWVVAGNPLWPQQIELLGRVIFAGDHAALTMSVDSVAAWLLGGHADVMNLLYGFWLFLGLTLVFLVGLVRGRWSAERRIVIVVACLSAVAYLLTPYGVASGTPILFAYQLRFALATIVLVVMAAIPGLGWRTTAVIAISSVIVEIPFYEFLFYSRPDLVPWWPTLAIAVACVACWLGTQSLRGWLRPSLQMVAVIAGLSAIVAVWPPYPPTSRSTFMADMVAGRHGSGPVVVVYYEYMRWVLGPTLEVPISSAGAGPEGAQQSLSGEALTRAIVTQHPSLVVVGYDDLDLAPPDWVPPSSWIEVGSQSWGRKRDERVTVWVLPGALEPR